MPYAVVIRNIETQEHAESLAGSLISSLPDGTWAEVVDDKTQRNNRETV